MSHYSVGSIVHMDWRAAKLAATELLRLVNELHQQVAELEATVERLQRELRASQDSANASAHVLIEHNVIPGLRDHIAAESEETNEQ